MNTDGMTVVVRFDVRDQFNATLWERRSESIARSIAKSEARRAGSGGRTVVRVEHFGNVVRERRVASY